MNCKYCGKPMSKHDKKFKGDMCQSCHNYFRNGGSIHPLPPLGRIVKDERGYVICHICGKAYKRLGSHVKEKHGMTIAQYKEKYGLCANARTTEKNYHQTMRKYALDNDMDEQLKRTGIATRIQKGDSSMRGGKEVRLQECLDKSDRYRKD